MYYRAYAAALLPFPLAVMMLTVAFRYTPNPGAASDLTPVLFYLTIFPVSILNGIAATVTGAGPLGEEGGWRGYLLPALLKTRSKAHSSFIIGVVWTLWHLPVMAFFSDWRDGIDFWNFLPVYLFVVVALSFLMTRIWLIGGGSLVPIIWFHGLFNTVGPMAFNPQLWSSNWPPEFGGVMLGLAAILATGTLSLTDRRQH